MDPNGFYTQNVETLTAWQNDAVTNEHIRSCKFIGSHFTRGKRFRVQCAEAMRVGSNSDRKTDSRKAVTSQNSHW